MRVQNNASRIGGILFHSGVWKLTIVLGRFRDIVASESGYPDRRDDRG